MQTLMYVVLVPYFVIGVIMYIKFLCAMFVDNREDMYVKGLAMVVGVVMILVGWALFTFVERVRPGELARHEQSYLIRRRATLAVEERERDGTETATRVQED